jgi:FlaA1/EpsC-like NDP-sugar epimerase
VLVLDWLLAIFLFGGLRFAVRGYRENRAARTRRGPPRARALIVGAGDGAERLLRQVHQGGSGFRPVALVDDDRSKLGMRLHRVPVIGTSTTSPRS